MKKIPAFILATLVAVALFASAESQTTPPDKWTQFTSGSGVVVLEMTSEKDVSDFLVLPKGVKVPPSEVFLIGGVHRPVTPQLVTESRMAPVVSSQFQSFLALEALEPEVIFCEGNTITWCSEDFTDKERAVLAHQYFPPGWYKAGLHSLNERQKQLLYWLGAGYVYFATRVTEGKRITIQGCPEQSLCVAAQRIKDSGVLHNKAVL